MELTGDLSDFALADILQILALSKKSGTLLVENEALKGKVLIESGKIIGAWSNQGRVLGEGLLDQGARSGLLTDKQVHDLYKRHLQSIIGNLISIEKGRFGLSLSEESSISLPGFLKGGEGVDVEELLLASARAQDESRISNNASDNFEYKSNSSHCEEFSFLILSLLAELRSSISETDVSLMILRCASELMGRGILFGVRKDNIYGIGQFGLGEGLLDQRQADYLMRSISIPISGKDLVAVVGRTGQAFYGVKESGLWGTELDKLLGVDQDKLEVSILPVLLLDKTRFILYVDNHPFRQDQQHQKLLSLFIDQAGVMLDRLNLLQQFKNEERYRV